MKDLKCPICARPVSWNSEFPFKPFCSERCKLIDLGAWDSGDRSIPGQTTFIAQTPSNDTEPDFT